MMALFGGKKKKKADRPVDVKVFLTKFGKKSAIDTVHPSFELLNALDTDGPEPIGALATSLEWSYQKTEEAVQKCIKDGLVYTDKEW